MIIQEETTTIGDSKNKNKDKDKNKNKDKNPPALKLRRASRSIDTKKIKLYNKRMVKKKNQDYGVLLAKALSIIFNPIITFALAILIGSWKEFISNPLPIFFFGIIGITPVVLYYLILIVKKHNTSLESIFSLSQKERNNVYQFSIIPFFYATVLMLHFGETYWALHGMVFCILFGLLFIGNKFIDKASVHAAGASFGVIYLADKLSIYFALLLVFLPIIYWARIKIHKHSWLQLMFGTVIGMTMGLLTWFI